MMVLDLVIVAGITILPSTILKMKITWPSGISFPDHKIT